MNTAISVGATFGETKYAGRAIAPLSRIADRTDLDMQSQREIIVDARNERLNPKMYHAWEETCTTSDNHKKMLEALLAESQHYNRAVFHREFTPQVMRSLHRVIERGMREKDRYLDVASTIQAWDIFQRRCTLAFRRPSQ